MERMLERGRTTSILNEQPEIPRDDQGAVSGVDPTTEGAIRRARSQMDDQTPPSLSRAIISRLSWREGERVLEPARGDGNFYDNLPALVDRDWCEIKEGRDFFDYSGRVNTVITNPPFRDGPRGRNLFIPFLEHSFEVATDR